MMCARFMDYEAVWAQALGSTAPHGRRLHKAPYFKALVPGGYTFDLEAEGHFHVTNAAQPWALLDDSGAGAAAAEALSEYGVTAEAGGVSAEAADLKKFLVNNTANLISCINDTNCEGLFADADIEQVTCTYRHARTHALRATSAHTRNLLQRKMTYRSLTCGDMQRMKNVLDESLQVLGASERHSPALRALLSSGL